MATVKKGGEVGVVQGLRIPGMSRQRVIERGAMSSRLSTVSGQQCACVCSAVFLCQTPLPLH